MSKVHTPPFILKTTLTRMYARKMIYKTYTQNRLLLISFAPKFQNFAANFEYRADKNTHILTLFGKLWWFVGFESPVVGGGTEREFCLLYPSTKGSFYLTDGKSARLTLMKPLECSSLFPSAVRSHGAIKEEPASIWELCRFFKTRKEGTSVMSYPYRSHVIRCKVIVLLFISQYPRMYHC